MPQTNAPSNYGDIIGLLMPLCAGAKLSDNVAAAVFASGRTAQEPPPPAAKSANIAAAAAAATSVIKMPSGDVFGA